MAETILYGIARDVLKKLGSLALSEIASAWGFKNKLNKLKDTIETLENVLLDAEDKQAHDRDVHGWLERLATVVYAADDLFDEYGTVAARKQLMDGNKVTKEVITFFSHSNQVALAVKISWKIKKIRKKLDDIEKEGRWFQFVRGSAQRASAMSKKRDDETGSYKDENEVVGRDDEKKDILDMLLAPSSNGHGHGHDEELPVISIVGMGGMGKTTLAQLIYKDPQVKESFDLRLWVCVSEVFDKKAIIEKLLQSATKEETQNLAMDPLQGLLLREVADKKYLLVLDDVWNENRDEWFKLRELLKIGRKGSKILVTTRSSRVAEIMGASPFELQKLSEKNSLILFEKIAFEPGEAQQKPQLVEIGKEIVKKCGYVPLAIRILGSLLYRKEKREWLLVKDASLAKIHHSRDIMNILRFSYHHLWSPLKNCFAYCALFPKDFEFRKEMLIDLWIAEGFIVPSNDDQSEDDGAEEYFHTLLRRGFFQDIKKNKLGVIESCKMHDLMHDLAQNVAGVRCKVAKSDEKNFDKKSIHLSLAYQLASLREISNSMLKMKLLRTLLLPDQVQDGCHFSELFSQQLVMQFRSLRVLDLHMLDLKSLPSSIGKLIHLRYLDLSDTPIEKLPDSITDLWNLQTLNLDRCEKLRALPAYMRKLSNLRSLSVSQKLSHMPSGLGGLTSLNKLPQFLVEPKPYVAEFRDKPTAKLSDLKNLNNLRGELKIDIRGNIENSMSEATEAHLSSKLGLTELEISFPMRYLISSRGDISEDCGASDLSHDENVLEGLEPPSDIRKLQIWKYRGQKLPRWAKMDNICTSLPNLDKITLAMWKGCQKLPAFSQLSCLKRLTLYQVESVEYIKSDVCGVPSSTSSKAAEIETSFFPSLEKLVLQEMYNLKGWWKEVEESVMEKDISESASSYGLAGQQVPRKLLQFPKLSKLKIIGCPNLRMLPLCPNVEDLSLVHTNESLSILKMATTSSSASASASSSSSSSTGGSGLKLKKVAIDKTEDLMSLPHHCLHQLSSIVVLGDEKLENTERLGEVLASLSSSLRSLKFEFCFNLRSIEKGLEHLNALENLEFRHCYNLDVTEDDEEEGMPWKALNTSLRSLKFGNVQKLVCLPRGLQHLANLRSLKLCYYHKLKVVPEWIDCLSSLEELELRVCPKLNSLPEGFRKLTSLRHLYIEDCPGLTESCRRPDGRDWSKIQHIPFVVIRDRN